MSYVGRVALGGGALDSSSLPSPGLGYMCPIDKDDIAPLIMAGWHRYVTQRAICCPLELLGQERMAKVHGPLVLWSIDLSAQGSQLSTINSNSPTSFYCTSL